LGSNSFNVEEAIRFDDLGTSVTETISGFYSNIAEISLGDLANLYESIHGQDTFAQSGLVDDY